MHLAPKHPPESKTCQRTMEDSDFQGTAGALARAIHFAADLQSNNTAGQATLLVSLPNALERVIDRQCQNGRLGHGGMFGCPPVKAEASMG